MKFIASVLLLLLCLHGATAVNGKIHWSGQVFCHSKPVPVTVTLWEHDRGRFLPDAKVGEYNTFWDTDDSLRHGYFADGKYDLFGAEFEWFSIEPYLIIEIDCAFAPRGACSFAGGVLETKPIIVEGETWITENFEMCQHPFGSIFFMRKDEPDTGIFG